MTPDIRYNAPERLARAPHIKWHRACSFNGRSTWGYRLECTKCGGIEETPVGSSVSWEDAPGHFAWKHRECGTTPIEVDCGQILGNFRKTA